MKKAAPPKPKVTTLSYSDFRRDPSKAVSMTGCAFAATLMRKQRMILTEFSCAAAEAQQRHAVGALRFE